MGWGNGALYFSHMHGHQVYRWIKGKLEVLAHIPNKPFGLGFIGDATMLVASQLDRAVYKVDLSYPAAQSELHADVSELATWHLNDMVTDEQGNAYVGNFGSDAPPGEPITPAVLVRVSVDGTVSERADTIRGGNRWRYR